MAGPLHRTRQYLTNRRILLASRPACAIRIHCDGARATTADLIIPEALGGRPTLENMQPACRSCNSSKGARRSTRHSAAW